jgi:hypothetical protein
MSFAEVTNWLNHTVHDSAFWEDVASGLFVMVVEIFVTVIGVGLITSWLVKRQWEKSRQMLADVLLCSAGDHLTGVMKNFRSFLFEKDSKLMFISSVELYLARLELSLRNLNEQMLVHLPAALPETTEKLSKMTNAIAVLREHLLAVSLYLNKLNSKIREYDPANPHSMMIDHMQFRFNKENDIFLHDHAPRSDENYLFMSLIKVSQLTVATSRSVIKFFDEYCGKSKDFLNEKSRSYQARSYLLTEIEKTELEEKRLRQNGLYLFRYTPTELELDCR